MSVERRPRTEEQRSRARPQRLLFEAAKRAHREIPGSGLALGSARGVIGRWQRYADDAPRRRPGPLTCGPREQLRRWSRLSDPRGCRHLSPPCTPFRGAVPRRRPSRHAHDRRECSGSAEPLEPEFTPAPAGRGALSEPCTGSSRWAEHDADPRRPQTSIAPHRRAQLLRRFQTASVRELVALARQIGSIRPHRRGVISTSRSSWGEPDEATTVEAMSQGARRPALRDDRSPSPTRRFSMHHLTRQAGARRAMGCADQGSPSPPAAAARQRLRKAITEQCGIV